MQAILDLPMWLVGVIVIGGCSAVGVSLVLVARLFVRRHRGDEHNAVFGLGFGAAGTLYAIIAGLLVFSVYSTFDSASQAAAKEAGNLVTMTYNAHEFPQPQRGQAHAAIEAYTRSVVEDEWPALAAGGGSTLTAKALDQLFKVFGPMDPSTRWADQYSVAYGQLNDVVHLRDIRIDSSRAALPPIYWFLLVAGGFLIVVYMAFSYAERLAIHALAVGLMAAMLGIVLFLLLEVNMPFRGDISVRSDPFENALVTMANIG